VDGVDYPAMELSSPVESYRSTRILHGLPPLYRDTMLIEAQSSAAPHAWRVAEPLAAGQVDARLLEQARWLYQRDVEQYGNVFLTFLAERSAGDFELIGCAAARRRPSPAYTSQGWVVLGRLLAVSAFRGLGFGVHFQFTFFACSQTMCDIPAIGNFMATDTEQTRRLCRRAVETRALDMVEAGHKRWQLIDRDFDVEVFLAFYPGMRDWLRERLGVARQGLSKGGPLGALLDATDAALEHGYDVEGGRRLGALFEQAERELDEAARGDSDIALYADFLRTAQSMGTFE
jgi:hypothetical protein